jgi:hypothetical protein
MVRAHTQTFVRNGKTLSPQTALRIRHTLSGQTYGRKDLCVRFEVSTAVTMMIIISQKNLCVQRDPQYGDFGSHSVLKIKFSNFLIT